MGQDWKTVILKKNANCAVIDTISKKTNKEKNNQILENATEATAIKKITQNMSQQIIQGRMAKKMKRSQLAQAICEKESVVADYENGKAIVNQQILNKIGKALGIKIKKN